MGNEWRVIQRFSHAADQELFRRHVLNPNLGLILPADQRHIMQLRRRHLHNLLHLRRCLRIGLRLLLQLLQRLLLLLRGLRVVVGLMLLRLYLLILQQHSQLSVRQPGVFFPRFFDVLIPPDLKHADLFNQRVLDPAVQQLPAGILAIKDIVDVLSRLLGLFLVALILRGELNHVIAGGEDFQQRRQHPFNSVSHRRIDNRRAAFNLRWRKIANRTAKVILHRFAARLGQLAGAKTKRIADFPLSDRLDFVVGDFFVLRWHNLFCGRKKTAEAG